MIHTPRPLTLLAGLMLAGANALVADRACAQPVELRFHLPTGTSYEVFSQESMQMQAQMQDPWGNRQQMSQGFESPTNYRVEVLDAAGSGDVAPGRVRYSFAPGQTMTMTQSFGGGQGPGGGGGQGGFGGEGGFEGQGGFPGQGQGQGGFGGPQPQTQQQPLPFAGKSFEVTRRNGGITIDPSQNLGPETRTVMENLATFNESTLLPDRPVTVGDTWKPDTSSLQRAAGMAPGGSLDMTARLREMGQAAGRPAALLDLQLVWNNVQAQGMTMQGTQQGRASIDVATGLLMEFELAGQLQISAAPQGPGQGQFGGQQAPQMQGTSMITSRRSVRNLVTPAAGFAAKEAVTEAPAGPGASSAEEPGGGEAGAVLTLSAPPFEGTFVGETLTVTLIEGERRAISIQRGELTSRGQLTGNREIEQSVGPNGEAITKIRFQGEFTVNDASYPFSAEQPEPDTLLFTTGKTTQTLRRKKADTPPNPFE